MRRRESGRIALCGMMGALSIVVMLMGSIIPVATFCAPLISSMLMMTVAIEFGVKTALLLYVAVALIALLMLPDREMAFIFMFLLGYYPMLKVYLEKLRPAPVRMLAKLAVFNAAVLSMYGMLLYLFPIQALVDEFSEMGRPFVALLLVLGNVAFVIYDRALVGIAHLYLVKFRPMLARYL